MIGALTGTVFSKKRNPIILMTHGVGYAVHVPLHVTNQLHEGDTKTLFIHTHVRDDTLELYGFATSEELDLFKLLLDVPGVGPRTAIAIIDHGVSAITQAVTQSDVDFFTTIPRLGKKNAQKIIIELKSKLGSTKELDLTDEETGEKKQVIEALESMGFARHEVLAAIKQLNPTDASIEQKIRHALKLLGKTL